MCSRVFNYQNMTEGLRLEVVAKLPRCQPVEIREFPLTVLNYFCLQTNSRAMSPKFPSAACPN